ncbi:TraM recognition domain-containing protein [Bosea sp. ANAM02]|uniref:type IV secretory system conjugative DNA transfer family protein n=1 Tax=Bosea sp. ANAM02 TaxID=2020412 RepID=UPI00140EDDE8|nr:TraM recognition domain-containing protein [Bosea sp. ANAM02]BCB22159.1 hypothetical protein OCUBac02_50530 [Bosea sp. ANAM02]
MAKMTRGLKESQELNVEWLHRDARPLFTKFADWMHKPANASMAVVMLAAVGFVVPAIGDVMMILALAITAWALSKREGLDLRLPAQSGLIDPNNPMPNGAIGPAKGIFFLGNDMVRGSELWLGNDDCRQHFLVLGTTGAGKTEALIGFVANALSWNSGFLFCDGKADVSLYFKLYALMRYFGREDDLLVINFMTGNRDTSGFRGDFNITSNTLNPFSNGSSDSLTQLVISLMDETGGDGALWKGRASAMFTGVMRALVWLREQNVVDLNVGVIRDYLSLKRIIDLAKPTKYPDMPPHIRHSISSYLTSLPGYKDDKGYNQAQTTLDQHGYLEMQFTKIMGSLADVYGYIFSTPFGEVDMADVVLNRRGLVIMLPALEKADDEIANLGKIVVATLKGMMGNALGSELEGTVQRIVDNRVTNSSSPFPVILDECGYYLVTGMAVMAAQARSLGFAMIFGAQDLQSMKRHNDKEANSIIANTNTKIFMRTEEPNETAKLAIDRGGKGQRSQLKGYQAHVGELTSVSYRDNSEAGVELIDRVDLRDLTGQKEGQMHVTHGDKLIRARSFYADPPSVIDKKTMMLAVNHFIIVEKPSLDEVEFVDRTPDVLEKLLDPAFAVAMAREAEAAKSQIYAKAEALDEIAVAAQGMAEYIDRRPRQPVAEAACVGLFQVTRAVAAATSARPAAAATGASIATPARPAAPPPRPSVKHVSLNEDSTSGGGLSALVESMARQQAPEGDWRTPADLPPELLDEDGFHDEAELAQLAPDPDERPLRRGPLPEIEPRPVTLREIGHGVDVAGKSIAESDELSHDAFLRVMSDAYFDPASTTAAEVEKKFVDATGGSYRPADPTVRPMVDAAAHGSDRLFAETAPEEPLAQPGSDTVYVSDFLASLMSDTRAEEDA